MDVHNELDLQFLDMCDLNDKDKNALLTILKSDALKLPWDPTETNNEPNFVPEIPEVQNNWHHNSGTEETYMKYASENDASSLMVSTMLPAHTYAPQMMTTMCNDWTGHMFMNNVSTDPHVAQFMPSLSFPCVSYNIGADTHEVASVRENGRRNNRGRGMRRDNFNRGMNSANNDVQSGYVADQGQYHQVPTVMYLYPEHPMSPQQHQVTGPIYYAPPMYSPSTLPPHPNSYAHPHQPYPSQHNQRYVQQSQSMMSQVSQDSPKATVAKPYEKRTQKVHVPSKAFYPPAEEDNSSSQTNIIATLIVKNCQLDTCTDDAVEHSEKKGANNSNKVSPVNVTIEHNIVSTVNETCNGAEKKDIPCVNINSSIEVKQNGDTNKEYKKETVSSIKTTVVKTLSKSTSKSDEKEIQSDEHVSRKSTQAGIILSKQVIPTTTDPTPDPTPVPLPSSTSIPTSVSLSDSAPVPICTSTVPIAASVPTTLSAPPPTMSWAGILKKGNSDVTLTPSNFKPTAKINPLPADDVTKTVKSSIMPNNGKHNDDHVCSTTAANELLQNRCDDPRTLQMGAFLLKYQMEKQTVSLLPRGLTNRSNYCYINSILQALLACPPFYNLLSALPYQESACTNSSTPLIDNMVKFVNEFTALEDGARLPRKDKSQKRGLEVVPNINCGVAFEPSYVYMILKNLSAAGVFSVEGRQEDAEEFLSCLLNGINDEMLEVMKLVSNDTQSHVISVEPSLNSQEEEEWKVKRPKNKGSITRCTEFGRTPLSDIFRGQLRSTVLRAGEQHTDNVQPFFTLQLDIRKAESVNDALNILVVRDPLEGMTCSRTKQQIKAWKEVTLEELPVVLILHLKWFDYKYNGCSKISKSVKFPIDLKVDDKLLSANAAKKLNSKQKEYKLFAVTYHDGKEATKGHYVTDAFHVGYQTWVRYDDSSVKCVCKQTVLNPTPPRVPYLLYYRRCDTIGNNQTNNVKVR